MQIVNRRNLKLLGLFLFGILVGPFLIPVRRPAGTVPPEQLADLDSRFLDVRGLRLHYKTAGRGEPALLLLHGLGSSAFSWSWVMPSLAEYGTVVALDLPGYGLTSRPMPGEWAGESPYSPESQVEHAMELLDHLRIAKVVLIGHSAGGRIAALAALSHPSRVQALVLVDPAFYLDSAARVLRPLFRTPQMRRLGPLVARYIMESRSEEAIRVGWHDQSKVTPELLAGYRKAIRVENWDRGLWEVRTADRPAGLTKKVSGLRMPALVITGDYDRLVHPRLTMRVARELPNAKLIVIPECGHVPQEECPKQFVEAVTAFLSTLPEEAT